MNVTATPAPKSAVILEVEVPAERLDRAVDEAVRALSKRTRVPGFRPGKAPRGVLEAVLGSGAVLDEAVDRLVQNSYRDALIEQAILPLTNADVEIVQAEEGKPLIFKATVQVRPEVELGDYKNFNFSPEIETIDEPKVDRVIEELRDQNGDPGAGRGPRRPEGRLRRHQVRGQSRRRPIRRWHGRADAADHRRGPAHPGFEDNLVGLSVGDTKAFDITFPDDYLEKTLAGKPAQFDVELRELREKVLPDADDDFARSMGDFADMAAFGRESRNASSAMPSTRRATSSPTRSSTTRSPTRPSTCPTSSSTRRSR